MYYQGYVRKIVNSYFSVVVSQKKKFSVVDWFLVCWGLNQINVDFSVGIVTSEHKNLFGHKIEHVLWSNLTLLHKKKGRP